MKPSAEQRNPVDVLAEEFAARLRNGETPSIDEFVQRLPGQESVIRVMFPSIAMVERVGRERRGEHKLKRSTAKLSAEQPHVLGDFRIIRQIGRGSMGVVYEAHQKSLNRRVALKVLASNVADSPKQLERFRREAESAAGLHHTNIVSVFGTGEQDGLHFYAMQLIEGVSLSEVIQRLRRSLSPSASLTVGDDKAADGSLTLFQLRSDDGFSAESNSTESDQVTSFDLPSSLAVVTQDSQADSSRRESSEFESRYVSRGPSDDAERTRELSYDSEPDRFRDIARIGAEIAEALHYAHQQGVLHRDIKPSNLMMDNDGAVWITDFGLARHDDHDALTNTGDIVGTLRYMAPEQFQGECGTRSDICSLGLTLFELLTLTPAYRQKLHAALIKAKSDGPSPTPRSINSAIPADLETITMKACALSPDHRYQTAAELAADLKRFLEDRPIRARRVTTIEHLWRWSRRNPMTASLGTAALILLVALVGVFGIGQYRTQLALEAKQSEFERAEENRAEAERHKLQAEKNLADLSRALANAESEHTRAETNFALAVKAFEEIMLNVASRGAAQSLTADFGDGQILFAESEVTPADAKLLETLLSFFGRFAEENHASLTSESASARRRVGDIQLRLGRFADAEASYAEALDLYSTLSDRHPDDAEIVVEQARIINDMAVTASRRGELADASQLYFEARELLEQTEGVTKSPAGKFELARTLRLYSSIGARAGLDVVHNSMRPGGNSGFMRRGPFGDRRPERRRGIPGLAPWALDKDGLLPADRHREIAEANERARKLLTELLDYAPGNVEYRLSLARTFRDEFQIARKARDKARAVVALEDAIYHFNQLLSEHADSPVFKYELADALITPIPFASALQERRAVRAVKLCDELVDDWPNVPDYQALLGIALTRMATARTQSGRSTAVRQSLLDAVDLHRSLVQRYPSTSLYAVSLAQSLAQLAEFDVVHDQRDQAVKSLDEAIKELEAFSADSAGLQFVERLTRQLRDRQASLNSSK